MNTFSDEQASDILSIILSVNKYASAYLELEHLQRKYSPSEIGSQALLQRGDQKTGVIGEFYSLLYAREKYSKEKVKLCANPSNPDVDILVHPNPEYNLQIQVKTVSGHSKIRRTTPLNAAAIGPQHHLYLVSLNQQLMPDGFWVVENSVPAQLVKACSRGFTVQGNGKKGVEGIVDWKADRVDELNQILERYQPVTE